MRNLQNFIGNWLLELLLWISILSLKFFPLHQNLRELLRTCFFCFLLDELLRRIFFWFRASLSYYLMLVGVELHPFFLLFWFEFLERLVSPRVEWHAGIPRSFVFHSSRLNLRRIWLFELLHCQDIWLLKRRFVIWIFLSFFAPLRILSWFPRRIVSGPPYGVHHLVRLVVLVRIHYNLFALRGNFNKVSAGWFLGAECIPSNHWRARVQIAERSFCLLHSLLTGWLQSRADLTLVLGELLYRYCLVVVLFLLLWLRFKANLFLIYQPLFRIRYHWLLTGGHLLVGDLSDFSFWDIVIGLAGPLLLVLDLYFNIHEVFHHILCQIKVGLHWLLIMGFV